MAGSPALAVDGSPQVGDSCTAETVLPAELICTDGLVAAAPVPTDAPSAAPTPADPAPTTDPVVTNPPSTDPVPADPAPADPAPSDPAPVGGGSVNLPPVTGGGSTDGGGTSGGTTGGGTTAAPPASGSGMPAPDPILAGPTLPGLPVTADGAPQTIDPNALPPGTSLHAAATAIDPASTSNSLLAAATISQLAMGDLPTLASMRASVPMPLLADSPLSAAMTPSPLLANLPAAKVALSSVQAPLLAAGDEAATSGGFRLAGLTSKALPGLLVVLGTALVATVGAGNIRYWQERLGLRKKIV